MWMVLMSAMAALVLAGAIYLVARVRGMMPGLAERAKYSSWLAAAAPIAALGAVLYLAFNVTAMMVVMLHLILFWLLGDLIARIFGAARRKKANRRRTGTCVILFTLIYLSAGWFFAHHVFETRYELATTKTAQDLRVVEIADSHIGITLDGEGFARQMERVDALSPDVVVIVGDFVDDDTSREDMISACRALGGLRTAYGVYFVYGNHDNGYFRYRSFSGEELTAELERNGVTILRDESVDIGEGYTILGRLDRSFPGRASARELMEGTDGSRYTIMLDHQPNDYDAEMASGADLVLSGHTHGGHIFPAGLVGLAMGANDKVYGLEERGDTTFIVTSGISGWAIPFKTGAISEYVVIDIKGQAK